MKTSPATSGCSSQQLNGQQNPQHFIMSLLIFFRYLNDHQIPDQPMFLCAIMKALRQDQIRHLHSHWTSLVTSLLPFLGKSLARTVRDVTAQLCLNLERIAPFYVDDEDDEDGDEGDEADPEGTSTRLRSGQGGFASTTAATGTHIPADYVVTQVTCLIPTRMIKTFGHFFVVVQNRKTQSAIFKKISSNLLS